ncbi:hypothetical protein NPIL_388241 [Nephila pilipes]|uniref:Uncharacterized protein n=1 Tax=Nephila pilipes TaxID=299642 RepID=A0A8X6Q5F5_NEPPI|nr:hypothetical protein NPIL_388241 [Nephila pilipes]
MDTWFLHHDNANVDRANACTKFLEHPHYSSDSTPCDITQLPHVKMKMKGMRFSSDEDLLRPWENKGALVHRET